MKKLTSEISYGELLDLDLSNICEWENGKGYTISIGDPFDVYIAIKGKRGRKGGWKINATISYQLNTCRQPLELDDVSISYLSNVFRNKDREVKKVKPKKQSRWDVNAKWSWWQHAIGILVIVLMIALFPLTILFWLIYWSGLNATSNRFYD